MAIATKVEEKTVVTIGVTLELSLEEAQTILAISGKIGGSPEHSPRGHVDSIANALRGALRSDFDKVPEWELISRNNWGFFGDYPNS